MTIEGLALVTGAANGIGRAISHKFVAEGATVLAVDIDDRALAVLADELGDRVYTMHCDVTDERSLEAVASRATSLGGLTVAVANAGKGTYSPVVDHSLDEWRSVLDLCLTGVFLTVKHAGRVMHDGGSIITIASLNAIQPAEGMSAYCAAKAGVAMFTQVAAMELGHRRIRVNCIAPGLVQTQLSGGFWAVPGVVDEFIDNTTVGRFAQPDDIADAAAFLAGTSSTFVSGILMPVDGGAQTKRYPDLPGAFSRFAAGAPSDD